MNDLILRILTAVAMYNCSDIFWRIDGEYAPITIFANCNDLFYWGCADAEEITEDNIDIFEQSYKDSEDNGVELFCCRVRKMRPQEPYYKYINENEHHLFNECGPERKEFTNSPEINCLEFDN